MCGICGVIQVAGTPRRVIERDALVRMTDAMTHRGPNDRGIYDAEGVALGVRRLSIVDVEGGHQPVSNENGSIWAIQNGELFNHRSIRAELTRAGHNLVTTCDTEIIPHLYEGLGSGFPRALRGMFGIAVWDDRERRAVISRDRLGIKPLYYARSDDLLVFASELKGLLASGLVDVALDLDGIDAFLTLGYFPAPYTPLSGVSKLLPGTSLVVADGKVKTERFWEYPEAPANTEQRPVESYAEELLELLDESVRLRLMSDVPLGAMLSGGLDSSLIVALMARHVSEPVKTFSVGFRESPESNELAAARLVAKHLGTDHHELELSLRDDTVSLEELVWHLDEPLADLSSLGFLALSGLAARHVTVALSGQGADELFAGYRKHQLAALVGASARAPIALRRVSARVAPRRLGRVARLAAMDDATERLAAMTAQLGEQARERLYRAGFADASRSASREVIKERLANAPTDPLAAVLHLDAQLALPDDMLHYFDRASMAHSLEVRVPFLDHHVVEFCASVPPNLKLHRFHVSKYVLKKAARGLVPAEIIDKPKIGFFNAAVGRWFDAQAGDAVARYLLPADAAYGDFLDRGEVLRLVSDRRAERPAREQRLLLSILMLEIWLREYLPRARRYQTLETPAPVPS